MSTRRTLFTPYRNCSVACGFLLAHRINLPVTQHFMKWHQPRMWAGFSKSLLRLGLSSLYSLVCLLWVGAVLIQQQAFWSPGTGDKVDEQLKVPDISSCLSDQRKILEETFWNQVRKKVKRLEEKRKFILNTSHHHCSFICLLWGCNASKKIGFLSVRNCWTEFRGWQKWLRDSSSLLSSGDWF